MLVLVSQGKEDSNLTRLEELEIALPALFFRGDSAHLASPDPLNAVAIATSPLSSSSPQLNFARFGLVRNYFCWNALPISLNMIAKIILSLQTGAESDCFGW